MHSILIPVLSIVLVAAIAPAATAQRVPEVGNNTTWGTGRDSVLIQVTENPAGGSWITAVNSSGSDVSTGNTGPNSTPNAPTTTHSVNILRTPDGAEYMIDRGVVKKKNAQGKWVKQKKQKNKKKTNRNSRAPRGNIFSAPDDVVSLPY